MSPRGRTLAVVGIVALVVAGLWAGSWWAQRQRAGESTVREENDLGRSTDPQVDTLASDRPAAEVSEEVLTGSWDIPLYFPSGGTVLRTERREVVLVSEKPEDAIQAVVDALLDGPRSSTLYPPLPSSVRLLGVYRLQSGEVVLDLQDTDTGSPPPSGSTRELLTVFSLVNSVALNVEGAERVVLVWNGVQPTTFAGHVDTSIPLRARADLIAGGPEQPATPKWESS